MSTEHPVQASGNPTDSLPLPDPAALQHSTRLADLIREEMNRNGGRLPFDRYMELALYAPSLGYYTAGARKFGEAGDFVTAPELSPLFARCLARQCRQVLAELGGGDLLEFGAGTGALAAELLKELQLLEALPERYLILELSSELKARQREAIHREVPQLMDRVHWLDGLPEAGFRGVVVANELLDAMPVHRFRVGEAGIREQFVTWTEGDLTSFWDTPSTTLEGAVTRLLHKLEGAREDYESEINLRAAPWLRALAERFDAGLILLIDYGYAASEYYHPQRNRGSLMCHYRHRAHPDPLFLPGLQDITAHVDFTALAEAALESGLSVCGYATQAFFLMGCGLDQLLAESNPDNVRAHMQLVQGAKRLTLPSEMGERFKVLGLGRGLKQPIMGFRLQDLRGRL